ncbi:response regulator transcription factor [Spirilliplanes yamanashiensis]|uniref:DNA-binding response regulator n=1 Tax=Spirilliplanes yamanashiensis TaxID=42233 RepID=A0A8J3YBS2_9ACTN|nr:response regulator transcription factor [Spirilliplanes yamanashiensis]MDP9818619.1 DNA-binding NarL/FixJ family response regulator [Spirilliplanes yamanashiensis]GIJ05075.1 DNA-binding response regulator [Spirilliplanes yamanashiensis]
MADVRVVVVDDQPLIRAGIVALLTGDPGGGIAVAGEASDGAAGVALARRVAPDVVLMDIRMPGLDGIAATRQLRAACPGTAVLMLTTFDTDDEVLGALRAGAHGYLLKDASGEALRAAVHAAARGEPALAPGVARRVMDRAVAAPVAAPDPRIGLLTARELEVLREVARGDDNAAVAARLRLSPDTVRTYVSRILTKLGAASRAQAVAIAHRSGLGQ